MNTKTILFYLSCLFVCAAFAGKQPNIKKVDKNIALIKKELQLSAQKKAVLQKALAKTESNETYLNHSLKNVAKNIQRNKRKLAKLQRATIPLRKAAMAAKTELQIQLKNAYILSQTPTFKTLLSNNNALKTQQTLMYYHYLTQAQIQNIKTLEDSIAQYQANQKAIQQQTLLLYQLKSKKLQYKKSLNQSRSKRLSLIQAIEAKIKSKNNRLQSLLSYKAHLQQAINALHTNERFYSNKPFQRLQGKLPWPVAGKVIRRFGNPIENSQLKWDGDLISAPEGRPIRAIADGRVIFAKWMPGYGLLLILNHGNGYMSLYGRNQSIDVKVGETVNAGEVVATVGDSGGFPEPALYFSLRHNTAVLNPALWCKHG